MPASPAAEARSAGPPGFLFLLLSWAVVEAQPTVATAAAALISPCLADVAGPPVSGIFLLERNRAGLHHRPSRGTPPGRPRHALPL